MIHTWLGWLIVGIIAVALFGWIPVVGLFYLFQNGPTGTPGELLAGQPAQAQEESEDDDTEEAA